MPRARDEQPSRTGARPCGFSLVELIVVIVLVAIMAAAAVPAIGSMSAAKPAAAARLLARDLTFARQQALARGVPMWAVFSTTDDRYSLLVESVSTPGRAGATALTDPATGREFVQSFAGGEFSQVDLVSVSIGGASGTDLGFDWLGRPLNASGDLLTAASTITLGGGHSVTVEPQTGLATVHP